MKEVAELDHRRGAPDAGVVRSRVYPADLQREADILVNGEVRVQAVVLETIATSRSFGSRSLTTRSPIRISPSVGSSRPAIMRMVVVFATARWAEEHDELAIRDSEIEIVHAGERSPPFVTVKPDLRHGTSIPSLAPSHAGGRQTLALLAIVSTGSSRSAAADKSISPALSRTGFVVARWTKQPSCRKVWPASPRPLSSRRRM